MSATRKRLHQFHQGLYEKSKNEALSYPGFRSKAIQKYSEDYHASLPKGFRHSQLEEITNSITTSRLLLYGDFHTLKQSQKGFIRIIHTLLKDKPGSEICVFLEMLKSDDQASLSSYLSGAISETDFLEQVDYYANWGFPWENYRYILDFCRHFGIQVRGLNTPRAGRDTLKNRDIFATKTMADHLQARPNDIICCLVGEYHLSDQAIPLRLQEVGCTATRVFNNIDDYYFNIRTNITISTEYLYLKPDTFCILNAPPWIKWHSYCLWEESRSAINYDDNYENVDDEDISYTEDCIDIDFHVQELVKHMCTFLGLQFDAYRLSHFVVHYNPDQEVINQLRTKYRLKKSALNLAVERLSQDGYYYVESNGHILLADLSLNNMSRIVGQYLHNMHCDYNITKLDEAEQFAFRCLNFAAGELAGLILNPKIRLKTAHYFSRFLESTKRKRLYGIAKIKRSATRQMLELRQIFAKQSYTVRKITKYSQQDRFLNHELSLLMGTILAHGIYSGIMNQKCSPKVMVQLVQSAGNPDNLIEHLAELVLLTS